MSNKKITSFIINDDDVYFIIEGKEISVLKLMNDLDKKIGRFALGSWIALGLAIVLAVPSALFQLSLTEKKEQSELIKEQSELIKEQSETIQKLSDRLLIIETKQKIK